MENLKNALSTIIETAQVTVNALEDNKISLTEGVAITWHAIGFVKVIKTFPAIADEFLALTPDQKQELITWFNAKFDLPDDNAEQIVEMIFETLLKLSDVFVVVAP